EEGSRNGACRMALRTRPDRMHCVQTRTVLAPPPSAATLTRCRFGLNLRRAIPVTLVPTPPRYFALPRVSTVFPICEDLPHTSHTLAISYSVPSRQFWTFPLAIETRDYSRPARSVKGWAITARRSTCFPPQGGCGTPLCVFRISAVLFHPPQRHERRRDADLKERPLDLKV